MPQDYFTTPWPNFGVWGLGGKDIGPKLRALGGAKWDRKLFFTIFQKDDFTPAIPTEEQISQREKVKVIKCLNILNPFKKMVPLPKPEWETGAGKIEKMMIAEKPFVDVWETQNEPMVGENFHGTMADVMDIIRLESGVVRKNDPGKLIAGICLNPMSSNQYLQIVNYYKNYDIEKYIDGVSIHPYIPGAQPPDTGGFAEVLNRLSRDLNKVTGQEIPLYISEIGYSTKPGGEVTEIQQAAYLTQTILLCRKIKNLRACVWHIGLWNEATSPRELCYGILRPHPKNSSVREPKPAFAAWANVSRQTYNANFLRDLEVGRKVRAMLFERNKSPLIICYALTPEKTQVKLYVGGKEGTLTDTFGTPSSVLLKDGVLDIEVSEAPVYFSGGDLASLTGKERNFITIQPDPLNILPGKSGESIIDGSRDIVTEKSEIKLDLPENWTGTAQFTNAKWHVKIITGPDTQPGEYPVFAKVFNQGKVQVVKQFFVNVAAPLELTDLKPASDGKEPVLSFGVKSNSNDHQSAIMTILEDGNKVIALQRIESGKQYQLPLYFISYGAARKYSAMFAKEKDQYKWSVQLPDIAPVPIAQAAVSLESPVKEWPVRHFDIANGTKSKHQVKADADIPEGTLALGWDNDNLHIGAIVNDRTHLPEKAMPALWNGDSIQLGISTDQANMIKPNNDGIQETAYAEIGISPLNQENNSWVWASMNRSLMELQKSVPGLKSNTIRKGNTTEYRISIPWQSLNIKPPKKGMEIGISILFNDRDEGGRHWVEWYSGIANGKDPNLFGKAFLQ